MTRVVMELQRLEAYEGLAVEVVTEEQTVFVVRSPRTGPARDQLLATIREVGGAVLTPAQAGSHPCFGPSGVEAAQPGRGPLRTVPSRGHITP